ncbi:MAG: hypothetical protein ACOX2M_05015 [Fastidiosipilaceae bacterium]
MRRTDRDLRSSGIRWFVGRVLICLILAVAGIVAGCADGLPQPSRTQSGERTVPNYTGGLKDSSEHKEQRPISAGTFERPVSVSLADYEPVSLPDFWRDHPFTVLHELPDRGLILHCRSRISRFDPNSGQETIIAEAAYGLQGAANDNYVVYGVGGDEVQTIVRYDLDTGSSQAILSADEGMFGFELDRSDIFYTTRIKYEHLVKMPAVYQAYQLPTGPSNEDIPQDRSRALTKLKEFDPEVRTEWSYQDHQPWTDAFMTLDGELFALTVEYESTRKNQFNYYLTQIGLSDIAEPSTGPVAVEIARVSAGAEPMPVVGRNWIAIEERAFSGGNWYKVDEAGENRHALGNEAGFYRPLGFREEVELLVEVDQNNECLSLLTRK